MSKKTRARLIAKLAMRQNCYMCRHYDRYSNDSPYITRCDVLRKIQGGHNDILEIDHRILKTYCLNMPTWATDDYFKQYPRAEHLFHKLMMRVRNDYTTSGGFPAWRFTLVCCEHYEECGDVIKR